MNMNYSFLSMKISVKCNFELMCEEFYDFFYLKIQILFVKYYS